MNADILFFFNDHMVALPIYALPESLVASHNGGSEDEIDAELMGRIREAAEFSDSKR